MATKSNGLFGKVDEEAVAQDRERTNFFKPKNGNNRVRILPQSSEAQSKYNRYVPYVKSFTHFGVGFENKSMVCPLKSGVRSKCYICSQIARLPEKERKELAAKKRFRFVIWDYEAPDKGLQIWEVGYTVKDQLDSIRDLGGEFTDVDDGFDIIVGKTGEGVQSKYNCQGDRKNTPLAAEIIKAATDGGIPDLEATIIVPTDEELKATYDGASYDEDMESEANAEDEEEYRTRGWSVEDSEESDEELSDEESDEEETPTPASSFGRGRLAGARTLSQASAGRGTGRFASTRG